METGDTSITCAINVEWLNLQGAAIRKVTHRVGTVRVIRNELREMFLEIVADKHTPVKLKLKQVVIHNKFMGEGKASIKFNDEKCTVFISNAPPDPLIIFLRNLIVKISGGQTNSAEALKNARTMLLSKNPNKFEEISPVTNAELARAKMGGISKSTTTTPSLAAKKRKFEGGENRGPLAKRLYTAPNNDDDTAKMTFDAAEVLNDEQNSVLQTCLRGKSVFFTGSAGTGKSYLLRKIISTLPPDGTVSTASTGVAACLIGGVTLHSFAGIGDGEHSLNRCYELASRSAVSFNWRKCKRLIIDEISMIDGKYFEKIEAVARYIRRNDKPFGGIQIILCGDFLQLPPIVKNQETSYKNTNVDVSQRFCFQSPVWEKCIEASFELKIVHRQKDPKFVKILNYIRIGHVTPEVTESLLATRRQTIEANGILATQLCSHTNDANSINETKLADLKGEERTFDASDSDTSMKKLLDMQCPAPSKLILKIGAQVMLLKNISLSSGLVNGARGIIVGYEEGVPKIKLKNSREYIAKPEKWIIKTPSGVLVTRRQVPLKLAWAFSIHKSQGLTLDCVQMSLSKVFEAGQAYVALSRAQSLDSLRVLDFDPKQVWANPDVLQYYKHFRRELYAPVYVPLGEKNVKKREGSGKSVLSKFKKSLSSKPLVSIS